MYTGTEFEATAQFIMGKELLNTPFPLIYESYTFLDEKCTSEGLLETSDIQGIGLDNFTSPSLAPFDYTSTPAPILSSRDRLPDQTNIPGQGPSTPKMANNWRRAASTHDVLGHPGDGSVTPLRNLSTPGLSTPTWSSASSSVEDLLTPWDYENEPATSTILQDSVYILSVDGLDSEAAPGLSFESWDSWGPPSPSRLTFKSKRLEESRKQASKTSQSQSTPMKTPGEVVYDKVTLDLVPKPMFSCRYLGCHKVFRRREHLKRHKQTFHGEGPNRFTCEFCGRDQFNRRDNLNNHRKLHARPSHGNRTVKFIPAAIPIIEKEEGRRRRRATTTTARR